MGGCTLFLGGGTNFGNDVGEEDDCPFTLDVAVLGMYFGTEVLGVAPFKPEDVVGGGGGIYFGTDDDLPAPFINGGKLLFFGTTGRESGFGDAALKGFIMGDSHASNEDSGADDDLGPLATGVWLTCGEATPLVTVGAPTAFEEAAPFTLLGMLLLL